MKKEMNEIEMSEFYLQLVDSVGFRVGGENGQRCSSTEVFKHSDC